MTKNEQSVALIVLGVAAAIFLMVVVFPEEVDAVIDAVLEFTTSEQSRIDDLEPSTRDALMQLIQQLKNEGLSVYVGQTLRTPAEEKAAIDAGKSAVKTHSWHELGRAIDLYPINPDTGSPDRDGVRDDLFQWMQSRARDFGFRGIAYESDGVTRHYITNAKGKKIWDGGHIEYRVPYNSIAEAVAAEGSNYGIS